MMTHDDYLTLEKAAEEAGSHFHAIHNEGIFTPNRDISKYSVQEAFIIDIPLFYRTREEMDPKVKYNKMMMIDEADVLEAAVSRLPQEIWANYTILRSEPFYLEILNKNASKGKAVKALAEHLGIDQKDVMAIGDSGNDVDLVDFAGIGVAMDNATDEVKAVADVVTTSNNEHGVAQAIYKYALD
jgi:Cof subfamily protein (haloacid dehalogenase superfamily)